MIPAVLTHCASIDIGKRNLCLMVDPAESEPRVEVREFSTFNADLEAMKRWLVQGGCTHVVMESTGSYGKPVFNILEDSLVVCLANAEDVKGRKGHKTDRRDAKWLAHLLRHDLQKTLEDAKVKLGSVLSDVFGVSGQCMMEALLKGSGSAQEIAEMARQKARQKFRRS